nr:EamA family transporter [Methylobacterium sp. E-045]
MLFAAMAPGGAPLRPHHLGGAVLGLAGTAAIFMDCQPDGGYSGAGYVAAFGCALVWSGYSVLNRRFAHVPSDMLVGVCGAVAVAGLVAHGVFETTVWPDARQWLAVVLLGIGPTGLAFLAWDHAIKHGNVPLLGALSYLAPLLSTALLVATGQTHATGYLAVAALLIVGGALLAGRRSS